MKGKGGRKRESCGSGTSSFDLNDSALLDALNSHLENRDNSEEYSQQITMSLLRLSSSSNMIEMDAEEEEKLLNALQNEVSLDDESEFS